MKLKAKSGQVLILVLLVVVVALAVGLSVASRNLTNLKTSAQTEQSQRAFAAAEGGIEDVLSRLTQVASAIPAGGSTTQNVTVGSLTASVTVTASNIYQFTIDLGTVGQVDLRGASGQIQLEWANASDSIEANQPASLEVTQVSQSGSSYSQTRTAWSGGNFGGRSESGFSPPACTPSSAFKLCTRIPLDSGAVSIRIRPFWVKTTVKVTSVGGSLPVQTYNLASVATTTSGVTRKVQVARTALPTLPAAFDYVLFSNSDISK
ncbi:MAG: hypothetical protein Q7S45_01325 [Candidatus Curtissbacteria bacterium]|nr:hypothetical protein [Candidatus Curtissbacteria bacterium]